MIIYKATNTINGRCYIGQTTQSLQQRKRNHKCGKGYFHNALQKYGWSNFTWEVIDDTCQTVNELNEMEFHYIKQYYSREYEWGYNLNDGGGNQNGWRPSKETRKKISESNKGQYQAKGKDSHNYGRKHTKESKRRIGKASKRLKRTKQWKDNISKSKIGPQNPNYGLYGKDNSTSKQWRIIYPDGKEEIISGLQFFCKNSNLNRNCMAAVAKGKQTQHKGFKCEYYNSE